MRGVTRWLWLLGGSLLPALALAQPSPTSVPDTVPARRVVVKLAPLTLLELQNTLEAGTEVRLRDHFSLQGQFGYAPAWLIWDSSSRVPRYTNRENWRGRLEIRWYMAPRRQSLYPQGQGRFPMGQYLAIDMLYKQLNANSLSTIGHQCTTGNCAYFEQRQQSITHYVLGLGAKFGAQYVIAYNRESDRPHWLLDVYVGVSARKSWTNYSSLALQPGDQQFSNGSSGFVLIDPFESNNQVLPNLLLGLKIGYIL